MTENPQFEEKVTIPPAKLADALFRMKGGSFFRHGADLHDLFETMEFLTGPEGKAQKKEAADSGSVFVQRGILLMTYDRRILLAERIKHEVTKGHSILTSGSPKLDLKSIINKKIDIDPEIDEDTFRYQGAALSSPEQTGGINYLFEVHTGFVSDQSHIESMNEDKLRFVKLDVARKAVRDKVMEAAILDGLIA